MNDIKRIVVFGGAFNPPLNSHFSLAEQIVNEYEEVDKVLFVPVNNYYNKPGLLGNEHRYNMLKLVIDKNPNFEISRVELDSSRPLFTIETMELLSKEYPDYDMLFTIGSDNLKEIHTWEKAEELVTKYKILVLERDEDNMDEIITSNDFLIKHKDSFIKVKNNVRSNLSSTFVRNKINEGKSIRYLTPDEVVFYIEENNLY
ncbi:MAG: nicotinate (nicotinamide) nucleotide adenylyltransferase [Clostridia bacterium]|nr:nicotinate (nicotinamide) nucleotide adenylyltransferase [Clostridia bacterium]